METITSLTGKWAALSNFFQENRAKARTAEHIFQAAKTEDRAERTHILTREKPGQAKYAGKRCTLRSDWELIKDDIMEEIVRRKFQDATLAQILDATGDATIVEGNRWHDNYWGQCLCGKRAKCNPGQGKNVLGNILMKIREENRRKTA